MRRLPFALALALLFPLVARAQAPTSANGILTAVSASCSPASGCVALALPSPSTGSIGVQVAGTFTGTLEFEASADNGTTWVAISGTPVASTTTVTSTTAPGIWRFSVGGLTNLRVRPSAFASGRATVAIQSASVAASLLPAPGGILTPYASGGVTANTIPKSNGAGLLVDGSLSDNGGTSDTQILFNDGGAFGGDAGLTWDKINKFLAAGPHSGFSQDADYFRTIASHYAVNFNTITADMTSNNEGVGFVSAFETNGAAGTPATQYGIIGSAQADDTSSGAPFALRGLFGVATLNSIDGVGNAYGVSSGVNVLRGNATVVAAVHAGINFSAIGPGRVTTNAGFYTEEQYQYNLGLTNVGVLIDDQGTGVQNYSILVRGGHSVIPAIATGNPANRDLAGQLTLSAGAKTQASTYLYVSSRVCVASSTAATPLAAQVTNAVAGTGAINTTIANAAAGAGYVAGDVGTVDGGVGATYRVDTIGGGGAVATYTITAPGTSGYAVAAAVTTTPTSGAGAGFKIDITVIAGIDTLTITVPGGVNTDTYNYICVGRD